MTAELFIKASLRNGRTYLRDSYYTQPCRLADITEDKNDKILRLMLISSSPGILDNDAYKIKIEIDEECSLELQTQGYLRLFHMQKGATLQMEIRMARASSLFFLPHPSVPHESSIFSAKNTFYVSEDCRLIWGEVWTCGRKLSGETFRFSRYQYQTEIFLSGKLVVKENLLMEPALFDLNAIGQLEGYTHQAALTCIGEEYSDNSVLDNIHGLLMNEKDICFGISFLSINGFIVRLLGYKAEQLHNILKIVGLHLSGLQKKKESANNTAYAK